ncbi:lipid-A-disaccharide synthase [Nitrosophilus kaiyonis]|uniref:lipid-A-disaccharide synthase n=1 Tax=Nitrosophilus kaiyonis TaxID=2930200 RepID=UPI00248F66A6|nr:lipid-A-disaccharide synthase [Nitrosophilus kaiyonis]
MKVLISAFERSANIHLAEILKHIKIEPIGIFDKTLGNPLIDLQSLSIMGFLDVLKKIPLFLELQNEMLSLAKYADKVLLIDSSGFNLPLAKKIKKRYPNKEIIYYILPQAWAWRKNRIKILEKNIDKLCSILPFEKNYYSKNAPIEYVGHPLLDEIKYFKEKPTKSDIIAFLPGSRKSEIKKLMPIFKRVRENIDKKAILVIPKHFNKDEIENIYGDIKDFKISHNAHKTLFEAEFAFICSGTATLESTLIGTPLALTYIAKPIDYFIAKNLVNLEYVGLANIFAKEINIEKIHPEFIQNSVTSHNLIECYKNFNKEEFFENSLKIREYLKHGSAKRVAQIIKG